MRLARRSFSTVRRFREPSPQNCSLSFVLRRGLVTGQSRASWDSLTESQRAAWTSLGWDKDRWEGRRAAPASSLQTWSQLTSEQKAAAQHGLGYTQQSWDESLRRQTDISLNSSTEGNLPQPQQPNSTVQVNPSVFEHKETSSVLSSLAQAAFGLIRVIAPDPVNTLTDHMSPPIPVKHVETTVYLDNSRSMQELTSWSSFTTRLAVGKQVLGALAPALGPLPCRLLKFDARARVLRPRQPGGVGKALPTIERGWDGSGYGTYLWHMIETDVKERYRPAGGKLRLVVVTDGDDNMSPLPEYKGMRGMDPLMRNLSRAGYDIEWHIILIGDETGLGRYKALAGATGGSFLAVPREFDPKSSDSRALLDAVQHSTDEYGRRERQTKYSAEASKGKIDEVDWFKKLPPGDKK